MSLAEVKEQSELGAYIVALRDENDVDLKRELAQKIGDPSPERWVPVEDVITMLETDPGD